MCEWVPGYRQWLIFVLVILLMFTNSYVVASYATSLWDYCDVVTCWCWHNHVSDTVYKHTFYMVTLTVRWKCPCDTLTLCCSIVTTTWRSRGSCHEWKLSTNTTPRPVDSTSADTTARWGTGVLRFTKLFTLGICQHVSRFMQHKSWHQGYCF